MTKPPAHALALAALAALHAPALRAQAPAPPPTIDACYVPASGTIYRIDTPTSPAAGAPKQCLSVTHARFTWNQQGPAGPAGPKGDKGDPGSAANVGPDLALPGKLTVGGSGTFGGALLAGEGPGAPIPAGGGRRLLWAPQRSALRAGRVSGDHWSEQKLGLYSAAFGDNTTASGEGAFAAGIGSAATAASAVAIGRDNSAGGDGAVALGRENVASSHLAVAIGGGSRATAFGAVAIGGSARATAAQAVALGPETQASGASSVAIGSRASTAGFAGALVLSDDAPGAPALVAVRPNELAVRATGGVRLRTSADLAKGCDISADGALGCTGGLGIKVFTQLCGSVTVGNASSKQLSCGCPDDSHLLSGGVRHVGGGDVKLRQSYQSGQLTWTATVRNDHAIDDATVHMTVACLTQR